MHQQLATVIGSNRYANGAIKDSDPIVVAQCFVAEIPQTYWAKSQKTEYADQALDNLMQAGRNTSALASDKQAIATIENTLRQHATSEKYLHYLLTQHGVSVKRVENPANPHPSTEHPISNPVSLVVSVGEKNRKDRAKVAAAIAETLETSGLGAQEIQEGIRNRQFTHQLGGELYITMPADTLPAPLTTVQPSLKPKSGQLR